MDGYLHPLYADSFSELGQILFLPKSKGWLIKRQVPGTTLFDAMGPYPLFFCDNWEALIEDINLLKNQIVTLSFVIGPLQSFPKTIYQKYFNIFFAYKNHYILDTTQPIEKVISSGRRYKARRALKDVVFDLKIAPFIDLNEWLYLYNSSIKRFNIQGIRAFSTQSFKKQIAIPNTHFFRMFYKNNLVSGYLFFIQNSVAYYHLSAMIELGYKLRVGYAAMWSAINELSQKVHYIEFGGGREKEEGKFDGLGEFKKGWANLTAKSYFCGKILDAQKYKDILEIKKIKNNNWFPAYRQGEFSN